MAADMTAEKLTLFIDGREVQARPGIDLLTACIEAGVMVPHFCWHGAMGSIGACRLCAVTVRDEHGERLEMSCMTPAARGQHVSTTAPDAARFRARIIEWLMLNHPHDCAVCEEGGACHLQDMTVATGHHRRRARFPKRTHRNQDLGPLLTHEMNRCIACYRCTRFYRGYAGGRDLDVFGAHDRVYFGRAEDGVLESPFAGNLAEVCPTGVFNDRHWSKHYARPWDLMRTPSVCGHCSVGCTLTVSERGGTLRKVENRYHGAINGFFLCDRGRFGPLGAQAPGRLTAPQISGAPATPGEAMARAAELAARGAIGIGSPRASLEANFALRRLVGPARFFAGVSDAEAALAARTAAMLAQGPARIASLKDIETADAALVLGEDLTGHAPRAALALRQTARAAERALAAEKGVALWLDNAVRVAGEGRRAPVTLVTPLPDALDDVAARSLRRAPDAVASFGMAVAAALAGESAADPEVAAVAQELAAAQAPVVIAGAGLGDSGCAEAAAAVAAALGARAGLALFLPEANSLGLALLAPVGGLESAAAARGEAPAIALEPVAMPGAEVVALAVRAPGPVAVALPVAHPTEAAGTFVNHEGRAQRLFAAVPEGPPAAWRVLSALAGGLFRRGAAETETLDDVLAAMAAALPVLAGAATAAPGAGDIPCVARAPRRFSGRTAHDLAGRVAEGAPPADRDAPLAWSMEGAPAAAAPAALGTGAADPGLHSPSAVCLSQSHVGGPLKGGDPGVRLIAPGAGGPPLAPPPPPEGPGLRVIPLHDPFAAHPEDLASPLLAARAPAPVLRLHPDEAAALGETARVGDTRLPVVADPAMPRGHVGLPAALARRLGARAVVEGEA